MVSRAQGRCHLVSVACSPLNKYAPTPANASIWQIMSREAWRTSLESYVRFQVDFDTGRPTSFDI
jgi:hypothetical protein